MNKKNEKNNENIQVVGRVGRRLTDPARGRKVTSAFALHLDSLIWAKEIAEDQGISVSAVVQEALDRMMIG